MVARMRIVIGVIAALVACGDNRRPEPAPQPLVPDPAVEVGCSPARLVDRARAKRVECTAELIGGRLASGRIGDFVLENDRVRVIVRGPGEGFYLHGSSGGGIVDAAVHGGEDLVKEILPVIDLSGAAFDELVITEAGDTGPAELVVRGPASPLDIVRAALSREAPDVIVEHHYRLAAGASEVELETFVFTPPGAESATHDLYDAMFMGGRAPAFVPRHGFVEGQTGGEVLATAGTSTSYGLVFAPGLPNPNLIDLAGIRLAAGPTIDAAGIKRWFVLGDGSVASVTERAWTLRGVSLGVISGTTAPGVDVVVRDGTLPITIARATTTGSFRVALPEGSYTLQAEAIGRAPGAAVAAASSPGDDQLATVPAGATGTLAITVRDDQNRRLPARVRIERPGADSRLVWIDATGDAMVAIPPGTWWVSISRGLEYDAYVASSVVVADAQTVPITATLAHVVDTAGWIALDTHLHSELSTDSTFPVDDRLRAVAAEGVEIPVSSDHDIIVDYTSIIEELGLDAWLGNLTGSETSSLVWGHVNGFPLAVDPSRTGAGSPRWLGRSPGEVFAALRTGTSRVVQINHPRLGLNSLFDAIALDPMTLTAHADPTSLGLAPGTDLSDLGFDAVEVANALGDEEFEEVFADYLQLVAAGHPAAATGSSDSHGPSAYAGEARTYVYVGAGNDVPATVSPSAIVDAIRARRVVVGTGAFVTAGIVTGATTSLPGDVVDVTGLPQVTLHIRVQAAAWQAVQRIRIYQGTQEIRAIALDPQDTAPVRYDATITVPTPAADASWVIRVDLAGDGAPVNDTSMAAFTNPLFARVAP